MPPRATNEMYPKFDAAGAPNAAAAAPRRAEARGAPCAIARREIAQTENAVPRRQRTLKTPTGESPTRPSGSPKSPYPTRGSVKASAFGSGAKMFASKTWSGA